MTEALTFRARDGLPRIEDQPALSVLVARLLATGLGGRAEPWDAVPPEAPVRMEAGGSLLPGSQGAFAPG